MTVRATRSGSLLAAFLGALLPVTAAAADVSVTIGGPTGTSKLDLGVTYTQHTLPPDSDGAAVQTAESTLRHVAHYQNIHIYGFGSADPEPSPGVYDWSSLDRRIAIVRATGGTPVLTLCCAPDWMKGGQSGSDSMRLNVAPLPEHFADYVTLVRQVARRYPDVRTYQVWNEMKGFWNKSEKRRDNEGYTIFYNQIYAALKQISPSIQVGGPYSPMGFTANGDGPISGRYGAVPSAITDSVAYWIRHKAGADFIIVDGHNRPKDGASFDSFANLQFYADVDRWLAQQTDLPIWWAEWYSIPAQSEQADDSLAPAQQNALMTATLIALAPTATVALRWGPERPDRPPYEQGGQDALWDATTLQGGGRPLPFAASMQSFERCFPPASPLLGTRVSDPRVTALASPACTLVVNTTNTALDVNIAGRTSHLAPYAVDYQSRTGSR